MSEELQPGPGRDIERVVWTLVERVNNLSDTLKTSVIALREGAGKDRAEWVSALERKDVAVQTMFRDWEARRKEEMIEIRTVLASMEGRGDKREEKNEGFRVKLVWLLATLGAVFMTVMASITIIGFLMKLLGKGGP